MDAAMASVGLSFSRFMTGLNLPKLRESQLSSNLSSQEFPSCTAVKEFCTVKALKPFANKCLVCRLRGIKRTGTICASIQDHAPQLAELSFRWSACKCCSRRSFVTFLGGTLIATAQGDKSSQAAESFSQNAEAIREAIHPARPGWYEELYATVMNTTMREYEAEVAGYKRMLFSRLDGNVKTVLELGVGTGPNFAYYGGRTSITNVIGVDPNEKMALYAKEAAVAAGFSPEQFKFVHAVGEGLPLPSASVDAVICTLVLCSVSDVSSALKEVQRVLRPGGIFLFVEHVAAPEGDSLRFWQNLLDPVQQLVADGCHLQRDTLSLIEAAQFASVNAERVNVNGVSLIAPHVVGSACVSRQHYRIL